MEYIDDNHPVIDLGKNIPLNCGNTGRYKIFGKTGRLFGIFKTSSEARKELNNYYKKHGYVL